ncbi:GNAT family N-acetyltransferase [Flammeovirga aprica]|uniref:GNAT family N-acetyltransferase n=1 Tax=Flammeovirga aprica JL-4 TaxID=694437 RepID=A0A7X9RW98_9BACT|nr:GNAT family N-acetyltransferase [Flammeovirga aprica]NME69903.1 GNAT family N-acetyltransferase [Flammeovirga aprica JL-4]
MIKRLTVNDAAQALEIVKSVIVKMKAMGIDQWDEHYPTIEDIQKDIGKQHAYGFYYDYQLAGYVIFNQEYDVEYNEIEWLNKGDNFLVMHRLSVHADFQGKGIARQLVKFGEELAEAYDLKSLRFDAFTKNPVSNVLYEKIGYKNLGQVTFRKGLFNCYEKLL